MPRRHPRRSEMVADATLVSLAAVRQTVKNLMLVRALRDDADFEEGWYAHAVRRELITLAEEADADAARLRALRDSASRRPRAQVADEHRSADRRRLKRRARVLAELSDALRRLADDEHAVHTILEEAQLRALDEIAATTASVPGVGRTRAATGLARSRALQSLRDELSDYAD